MNVLSLFSNIGVSEAYFKEIGVNVVVANELVTRRAKLYSEIYPETEMIIGDINNAETYKSIVNSCLKYGIDILIATPPCQGMSRAGKQKLDDKRNELVLPIIEMIKELGPKYVFIENVVQFLDTTITIEGKQKKIPELLMDTFEKDYHISLNVINTKDFSVPQSRERTVILMSRKDVSKIWQVPKQDLEVRSVADVIGHLPSLDPEIRDTPKEEFLKLFPEYFEKKKVALEISPWHIPPNHVKRQVITMMHTPSGCTAFDNAKYIPIKENGEPVRGYKSTYRRLRWYDPASTITMDNRKISSQNNVHPGRLIGYDDDGDNIYSDARALTAYELMLLMTIPEDWPVPLNTPVAFLRSVIGEGIPPLFVKKLFLNLMNVEVTR